MNPFSQELLRLWRERGRPSYRSLSQRTDGLASHTAIGNALNGTALPRWATARAILVALRADPEHYRELWLEENEQREQVRWEKRREAMT